MLAGHVVGLFLATTVGEVTFSVTWGCHAALPGTECFKGVSGCRGFWLLAHLQQEHLAVLLNESSTPH